MSDRQAPAFFAANSDLVLHDQFANIFESDRSLMQLHTVELRQGIDQIRGRDRFGYAVFPAPAFDEIIEQQSDYIIRRQKSAVGVYDAKAVGVAGGRNADLG